MELLGGRVHALSVLPGNVTLLSKRTTLFFSPNECSRISIHIIDSNWSGQNF